MALSDRLPDGLHVQFNDPEPATPEALAAAEAVFGPLPQDYVDVVTQHADFYVMQGEHILLQIWMPEWCVEALEQRGLAPHLPSDAFPCGDDLGGRILIYGLSAEHPGLYWMAVSIPDWEYATFVAPSLTALLFEGVGLEDL